MLPLNFKPQGEFNLLRVGGDNDGGYLIELNSIQQSQDLISMGIGKNWRFEEDFLQYALMSISVYAYDHSVRGLFWPNFFIKQFFSVLIGQFRAPFKARKKYKKFKHFFRKNAQLYYEKIGIKEGCTNLRKAIDRTGGEDIFLKIDIEGHEYEILDEITEYSMLLTGLVIEFHNISDHLDEIKNFIDGFELKLVHIHPNNNRVDEQGNPRAIEMTFAREPKKLSETLVLPHPLDQLNVPRKETVSLRFVNF